MNTPSNPDSPAPWRLLVASQKGGVGKTTTSVNLAAALAKNGASVLLVDTDPLGGASASLGLTKSTGAALPAGGWLWPELRPGLHLVELNPESDGDLEKLSTQPGLPAHNVVVVDSQPHFGLRSRRLLESCDELLLVLRVDALSFGTLPDFLRVLKGLKEQGAPTNLRGILLTLPRGEDPGGELEQQLRAKLGQHILPVAIPYDPAVGIALLKAQSVVDAYPSSVAAQSYQHVSTLFEPARA